MDAEATLARVAQASMDDLLAFDPVAATGLGDHRWDDHLPDLTSNNQRAEVLRIEQHLAELDAIDDTMLSVDSLVDLEILRAALGRAHFLRAELKRATWDPMVWNPATSLYLLLSREFAPLDDRRKAARARVRCIPDWLAAGRQTLDYCSAIHLTTAVRQLAGTREFLDHQIRQLLGTDDDVDRALNAVEEFQQWLLEQQATATRSPRLGDRLYAGVLWHSLDDPIGAVDVLRQAEDHLDEVTTAMREVAAAYFGQQRPERGVVQRALDDIAERWPVTNATLNEELARALASTREFTRQAGFVTVPDVDVELIDMPLFHRGVAVAYCDAPGPLERPGSGGQVLPTFVATASTPPDWDAQRVHSFYREYNGLLLHDLMAHEAFPGHVLQLAHDRLARPSRVRAWGRSGVFVEGWAVYGEEVLLAHGYEPGAGAGAGLALRLQQLKMQARMCINAILDVRVHTSDIDEQGALDLMQYRGFQESQEAAGKWQRALLTAGQLPTYFVGYQAVRSIVADLRVLHPEWSARQLHDLLLGHGSPAPRYLRMLLGL
ncbi:MAG: DUF885 family protein [Actinomycetales bacterium]|nr:DUF885 family protein [Actinomycetales bacterium]